MFYQISTSADPKIIGTNNGIYQVELVNIPNSDSNDVFTKLISERDANIFISKQDLLFGCARKTFDGKLIKNAKVTDLMGYSPYILGFKCIVSDTFRKILEQYGRENDYLLFPVEIRAAVGPFYLLFLPYISSDNIVFSKSEIFSGTKLRRIKVPIMNYDAYKQFIASNASDFFEKVVLPQKFDRNIICIQGIPDFFISKEFRDELVAAGVTGMEVLESCELEFV